MHNELSTTTTTTMTIHWLISQALTYIINNRNMIYGIIDRDIVMNDRGLKGLFSLRVHSESRIRDSAIY